MVKEARTSVTIVQGNYTPVPWGKGVLASELAWFLENYAGCDVSIITLTAGDSNGESKFAAGTIYEVKSYYGGKKKFFHLMNSLLTVRPLIRKAKKLESDWTIVMTDPSILSMWASLLMRQQSWILWSTDLYPATLFASGLLSQNSWLGKNLLKRNYSFSPSAIIASGPGQAQYLRSFFMSMPSDMPVFELPCGLFLDEDAEQGDFPEWVDSEKLTFGYLGEIGEAHDLEFVKEVIMNLDPERHRFILSVHGRKAPSLVAFARDYPVTKCVSTVSRSDLKFIDVHLATLESHWIHVSEPWIVMSAVCAGSTFMLKADAACDTWHFLDGTGILVQNDPRQLMDLEKEIQETDFKSFVNLARVRRMILLKSKAETFRDIGSFLQG